MQRLEVLLADIKSGGSQRGSIVIIIFLPQRLSYLGWIQCLAGQPEGGGKNPISFLIDSQHASSYVITRLRAGIFSLLNVVAYDFCTVGLAVVYLLKYSLKGLVRVDPREVLAHEVAQL